MKKLLLTAGMLLLPFNTQAMEFDLVTTDSNVITSDLNDKEMKGALALLQLGQSTQIDTEYGKVTLTVIKCNKEARMCLVNLKK